MLDFLNLKPDAFGLDISDLSLKIIKLQKRGNVLGLASFGETEIQPGIIEKGEIKDEDALVGVIKKTLTTVKGKKLNTKHVIASLPEEKAFLQVIQLPLMKEEEAKKAVYFEAENHIPMPIDKVYLDSQIIPSVSPVRDYGGPLDHLDILVAALPRSTADPYISVFKKAGLEPLVLEIESQAISRALIKKGETLAPLMMIDLGATRTSFIIFSGHSLRFTSFCPVCSLKFTQEISNGLGVDLKIAEELKIKYGIEGKKEGRRILGVLKPALDEVAKQIKKYLYFYEAHSGHDHLPPDSRHVEKIFLCGGGANLKGLTDFLSAEVKIPVEPGNPWINILPKPLKEVPELPYAESLRYTTALGLALIDR